MRTYSMAAADLADPDAIKTTIATATTAQTYSGAALNGAWVTDNVATPAPNGHAGLAMYPSATSSSTLGAFVPGSQITFVGTYDGKVVESVATVGAANGNETLLGDKLLDSVTEIRVDAQADIDGTWTFGFSGIAPRARHKFWQIEGQGTGNLVVQYVDGNDTIATGAGRLHELVPKAILAATDAAFTVYQA